jgi:hypothetical protein
MNIYALQFYRACHSTNLLFSMQMEYEDEQQQQQISLMMTGCGRQW